MQPKVFSYSRFSSPEQAKGDSLRRQAALAEKYAADNGLELDRSLKADEGLSAYTGANLKKGHLGVFIEKVRSGQVPRGSTLLIESLDRLSREDVLDALPVFIDIIKLGIRVVTLCDNQTYDEATIKANPMTLMMSLLTFARANEESEIKARRLKAAWANKRNNIHDTKISSRCPAWLRLSPDQKHFDCIPERVAVVKRLFKLTLEGSGKAELTRMLNQEGLTPWGGGGRKAIMWHESYVQKILTNPAVYGAFQPHSKVAGKRQPVGDVIDEYFPAIVSKEEFERVQGLRSGRRLHGGRKSWDNENNEIRISNIFSHIARCGRCGAALHYVNKGEGRKGGTYLVCARALRGAGCKYGSIRYNRFEKDVLMYLREVDWTALTATAQQDANVLEALRTQIEHAAAAITKNDKTIAALVEGITASGTSPQVVVSKISELEQVNETLRAQERRWLGEYQTLSSSQKNAKQNGSLLRKGIDDITSGNTHRLRTSLHGQLKFLLKKLDVIIEPEWQEIRTRYGNGNLLEATELLFPEGEKGRYFVAIDFSVGSTRWLMLSKETEVAQEILCEPNPSART